MAAGMKIVTIIKAGNTLPTLWVKRRGRKKGQDLPTEHVIGQMQAPSSGRGFLPSTVSFAVCNLGLQATAPGSSLSPPALAGPYLVRPGVKGRVVEVLWLGQAQSPSLSQHPRGQP